MSEAVPGVQQLMESPFSTHVTLAPGCGRLLHTTAGQLGRPAVDGVISRRGRL
jgi:hypothetical protein